MPGKHVHFADIPSTPSATFSPSSLASSPGPTTPLNVYHTLPSSPKGTAGSPHRGAGMISAQIHPLLARAVGTTTPLHWDLAEPFESARVQLSHHHTGPLTDALLREPATTPALSSLAIICDYLPWTLSITPTAHTAYVTVGDVLHGLFRALRTAVSDPELTVLEPAQRDCVRDAYVRRYRRVAHPPAREAEKAKMIKRVDFLRDRRVFRGLVVVNGGLPAKGLPHGAVWALHVARSAT